MIEIIDAEGRSFIRAPGARVTVLVAVAMAITASVGLGAPAAGAAAKNSGPVDVLYAGSLVDLMQQDLGPAFEAATGYTVNGVSAGSTALAAEIKGGTQQADVFISASPAVNASLQGPANGNWVSWYAAFATSPLVLGYNPTSTFAHALKTEPWYTVVDQPGFLLGRTNPATDPKGVLAVTALKQAAKRYHEPGLTAITMTTKNIFPEQTLVGELQAHQLDAGFFYAAEADAANLPTVPLTGTNLHATYTVTIVNRAPDQAAARSLVAFLLGRQGRSIMTKYGLKALTPPQVSGAKSAVPGALKKAVS